MDFIITGKEMNNLDSIPLLLKQDQEWQDQYEEHRSRHRILGLVDNERRDGWWWRCPRISHNNTLKVGQFHLFSGDTFILFPSLLYLHHHKTIGLKDPVWVVAQAFLLFRGRLLLTWHLQSDRHPYPIQRRLLDAKCPHPFRTRKTICLQETRDTHTELQNCSGTGNCSASCREWSKLPASLRLQEWKRVKEKE